MMTRCVVSFGILGLIVGAGALLSTPASSQQVSSPLEQPPKAFMPLVSFDGSYSRVGEARFERIVTDARWLEVWKEHMGDRLEKTSSGFDVVPSIDFTRCMVLCVFTGNSPQTTGVDVMEAHDRADSLLIRYDRVQYQVATFGTPNEVVPDYSGNAYGMWVLPRSTKNIVFEENVQRMIGEPPVWKERHRLGAL